MCQQNLRSVDWITKLKNKIKNGRKDKIIIIETYMFVESLK